MIEYFKGNLLEESTTALVNTVNTVGVMGKGIALMFKERFPKNTREYTRACKEKRVQIGTMFVTETDELTGPRWIINFPTKQHWRRSSKPEWITAGLQDLKRFIVEHQVESIAIPPLGAGNGGLDWLWVREQMERTLSSLDEVTIRVYEPSDQYWNTTKKTKDKKLTPAIALIAELVRRYQIVLDVGCSLLEIQKLAWFLQRVIRSRNGHDPLRLSFEARNYGPYADNLRHVLDKLHGHYLRSDKRIADSKPWDVIWFDGNQKKRVQDYLKDQCQEYLEELNKVTEVIDGFQTPYDMELLATVDWLIHREGCEATLEAIEQGIRNWPAGEHFAKRKERLFDRRVISIALQHLKQFEELGYPESKGTRILPY